MVSTVDSKSICSGSNPDTPTMEVTFKYQGKIISTPNLEKKLKRMKISIDDIEIIDKPIIIKKEENELDDFYKDKEKVIIRSTQDDIRRICFVQKGTRPSIKDVLKNQIWNPETKTGVYPELFIETMYYEILC